MTCHMQKGQMQTNAHSERTFTDKHVWGNMNSIFITLCLAHHYSTLSQNLSALQVMEIHWSTLLSHLEGGCLPCIPNVDRACQVMHTQRAFDVPVFDFSPL